MDDDPLREADLRFALRPVEALSFDTDATSEMNCDRMITTPGLDLDQPTGRRLEMQVEEICVYMTLRRSECRIERSVWIGLENLHPTLEVSDLLRPFQRHRAITEDANLASWMPFETGLALAPVPLHGDDERGGKSQAVESSSRTDRPIQAIGPPQFKCRPCDLDRR